MGVSRVWTGMLRRKKSISDALLYSGTSLTYALISFYTRKNAFDHVISPNTHFVLRSDINCTGRAAFADVSVHVS